LSKSPAASEVLSPPPLDTCAAAASLAPIEKTRT
jgi:hypothetical protein